MARLTKEQHEAVIQSLSGLDLTPEMMEGLQSLRDDFDESVIDGEGNNEGSEEWKQKYDELLGKYKTRFFSASSHKEPDGDEGKETEDEEKEEPQTFDDIFKKKED
jgi:hypothetical protein